MEFLFTVNPILFFKCQMQQVRLFLSRWAGAFSLWTGGLSVLCMPVSISLSQIFYALALAALLFDSPRQTFDASRSLRLLYGAVLLLYGVWALSSLAHAILERSWLPVSMLFQSDMKDVLLSGMALWAFHHSSASAERRRLLYRFLAAGFLILLGSGLIAVFTPFRLSRFFYHLQHGWDFSAGARLQHPIVRLPGPIPIVLHMPVGFLGTHLAYGAQLGLYFIPLMLFSIDRFLDRFADGFNLRKVLRRANSFEVGVWVLTGLSVFVLFLNSARSALFGILSALLAGVLLLTWRNWKKRAWILALPVVLGLIPVAGMALTDGSGAGRDFIMQSVGLEKKHSDYQRVLLWSTVVGLIEDHPFIGVGPGRFSGAVLDRMTERSADRSYLWYLYMQAERGHAHNDLLYQLAVAGVPAGLATLFLWFIVLRRLLSVEASGMAVSVTDAESRGSGRLPFADLDKRFGDFLPFAPVVMLFGGLFQCYFLDDQVLLPFWLMLGLAFHAREGLPTRG